MAEQQVESPTITPNTPPPAPVATAPRIDPQELAKVRDVIVKANPNAVPELIAGSTVDELMGSVENAVTAYQRIAEAVAPAATPDAPNVPPGGTVAVPLAEIPTMELIKRGIAAMKQGQ